MKYLIAFLTSLAFLGNIFGADNRTEALKRLQTKNLVYEAENVVEQVSDKFSDIIVEMSVVEDILADNLMVNVYEIDQEYGDILSVGGNAITASLLVGLFYKGMFGMTFTKYNVLIVATAGISSGIISSLEHSLSKMILEKRSKYFSKYQGKTKDDLMDVLSLLKKELEEVSLLLEQANSSYEKTLGKLKV